MHLKRFFGFALALSMVISVHGGVQNERLIVKFKDNLFKSNALNIQSNNNEVLKNGDVSVFSYSSKKDLDKAMKFFKENSGVASVEVDYVLKTQDAFARDPFTSSQWDLNDDIGGLNMPYDLPVPLSRDIVVAVIDTGVLNHQDLAGSILPGYDFVSNRKMANDGDGRDIDATDPGDWISKSDACYEDWMGKYSPSSWHGSHVAGTIAAVRGNGLGIWGVSPFAKILPVRALGICGGNISDIADSIRWAAGGYVEGAPMNKNPARVINLSLGAEVPCGSYLQSAIDYAISRGAVVIAAAGNERLNLDKTDYTPGKCGGVITVAATKADGDIARSYSNYGSRIDISAPGGDRKDGILSLSNKGKKTPTSNGYKEQMGTSMAAPHVAGVASLIASYNPSYTSEQIKEVLKNHSRSFTHGFCNRNGQRCGTGIVDVQKAIIDRGIGVEPKSTEEEDEVSDVSPISTDTSGNDTKLQIKEVNGGGCGTVDFSSKNGKGGPFSFMVSLLFGLGLIIASKKAISSNQSRVYLRNC